MSEETELKFIIHPDALAHVAERVSVFGGTHFAPQHLINLYFDTQDLELRRHGLGLRVRGNNDRYEMTAKTAGKIIGGLHQHPEYNIALPGPELNISLLPTDIWPQGIAVDSLQARLAPLFSTDYQREKWVITYGESEIEVAFDRGDVLAGAAREAICELEMELLSGNIADLLTFAQQISADGGLRLGSVSKAARGYDLAAGSPTREIRALSLLRPAPKASVEQGLREGLSLALAHWQYHEELWLADVPLARDSILAAIALVRETFVVMGNMIPRKATHVLREQLVDISALIALPDSDPHDLCYQTRYLQCKLAITTWLILQEWRASVDEKARKKLDGSFKRFADIMLSRCAAELKVAFGRALSSEEYQQQLPRLARHIMAFHLLSGFYPVNNVLTYILHWQALEQAIILPETNDVEFMRHQAVTQPGFWLSVSRR
ncbi:inorganic triphosphatase [Acerihabitans sp. TG2]|uniref:CYTH domain-containing protein n=1 Tax=Acerihabitans sp. TG2 TaxID=3096008 RepID=UPI002B23A1C8|nr:inorganic triphosphatase [Acerihabitans sp. TG2]MEA9390444.1 inorganic triphosphatase [Acerihabitans sp. TG2]